MIDIHVHHTRHDWLDALWSPHLRRTATLWPRIQMRAATFATPDAISAALRARGVAGAILSPELSVAPGPQIAGGNDAALRITRAMNDATAQMVESDPLIRAGLAVCNPFGGAADLAELRRAVLGLGLRGVIVGASYGGQGLDAPAARPLLELVATLQIPLVIHPTVDSPYAANRDFGLDLLVGMPAGMLAAVIRLLTVGVLDDLPGLTIILTHLGMGLAALLPWLDAQSPGARAHDGRTAGNGLSASFAERARRLYVDTATGGGSSGPGPSGSVAVGALGLAVAAFGVDHLLYGTDWPLSTNALAGDPLRDPAAQSAQDLPIGHLPIGPDGRQAILEGTATRLFTL